MPKKKIPELVAPAGDWSSLRSAVSSGADSAYFGVKGLNMRQGANNFDLLEIKKIVDYLHKHSKKAYLALNVIIYNHELKKVESILRQAKKAKVDAVILWDLSVLALCKKFKLKVHLSTQASVSNKEALRFYGKLGVKRAVLARECTLADIKQIAKGEKGAQLPEIETFIHGAMCVSVSGRCFLSHEAFQKSANRGECLQPCRRKFRIADVDNESEYILGEDYILSPRDLSTLEIVDKLIDSKIAAFKIEGRNRSSEYVRIVTRSYRRAIDAVAEGKFNASLKRELLEDLQTVYNRGLERGFYLGKPDKLGGVVEKTHDKVYIGEIKKFFKKISVAELLISSHGLKVGDSILVSGKYTPATFSKVTELQVEHKAVKSVKKGQKVGIKLPSKAHLNDKVFLYTPRVST